MLTKAQAIANHRKMWHWIAETTRKEKRHVTKEEAFDHFGWPHVHSNCWCCAYIENCTSEKNCPIAWPGGDCCAEGSPLIAWIAINLEGDSAYLRAADLAEQIADLPENFEAPLSKAETLYRHRVMWNWIAQTSIQEQRCVQKIEALIHFGWGMVTCFCWCCEYATRINGDIGTCSRCPITSCQPYFGHWDKACEDNDYITAARYAYQLAELPENPEA